MHHPKSPPYALWAAVMLIMGGLAWWASAEGEPSPSGGETAGARRQSHATAQARSAAGDHSTLAATSPNPAAAGFGSTASPFGSLDCSRQRVDPKIRQLCNPSETGETDSQSGGQASASSVDTSDMQLNISRLYQGVQVVESTLGIILAQNSCRSASSAAKPTEPVQASPECESARWQDIHARAEAALQHAYGRQATAQTETALALWQTSTTTHALSEYTALVAANPPAAPAALDAARAKFKAEYQRLKQFQGSRRFSDEELNGLVLALEGID